MAEKLLNDMQCRNATSEGKSIRKLNDGGGLYLWIFADGKKYWRLRYWTDGKEKSISLGVYPDTTLAKARANCAEQRKHLADNLDPSAQRKAKKRDDDLARANSFEAVAREWYSTKVDGWAPSHARDVERRLKANLYPFIGTRPIGQIDAPELLEVARKIERRGATDLSHRVIGVASQVFRFAIATKRCTRDPAADLRGGGALASHVVQHQPAVDPQKELPALLQAIDGYDRIGDKQTRLALQLLALVFTRTNELVGAEWTEFDLNAEQWIIPAERMKNKLPLLVPLSRQALAILAELKDLSGGSCFVFPGRNPKKPISNNTMLFALYRLGYKGRQTGHGFRRIASTLLNGTSFDEHGNMIGIRRAKSAKAETGFPPDVIERQLAHVERDQTRDAYNMAAYLNPRFHMMQQWADYLDRVREEAKVIPLRSEVA